jgi:hypothetical protein
MQLCVAGTGWGYTLRVTFCGFHMELPQIFITVLAALEDSALGLWVRESLWGFPLSLSLHAVGMGLLVGIHYVLALRLLGVAPALPWQALLGWQRLMWGSALLALVSGLMLVCAYPAKALTNPLFYIKLLLVAAGLWGFCVWGARVRASAAPEFPRWLAPLLLFTWTAAIVGGRFLAYTYSVLQVDQLVGT